MHIRLVESRVCRDDHEPKRHQSMHSGAGLLGGARWSVVAVDNFGWVRLDNLTEIEDSKDRQQQCMSVRIYVVRILWRENTCDIPEGCVL
jgi:hypothetical protein